MGNVYLRRVQIVLCNFFVPETLPRTSYIGLSLRNASCFVSRVIFAFNNLAVAVAMG